MKHTQACPPGPFPNWLCLTRYRPPAFYPCDIVGTEKDTPGFSLFHQHLSTPHLMQLETSGPQWLRGTAFSSHHLTPFPTLPGKRRIPLRCHLTAHTGFVELLCFCTYKQADRLTPTELSTLLKCATKYWFNNHRQQRVINHSSGSWLLPLQAWPGVFNLPPPTPKEETEIYISTASKPSWDLQQKGIHVTAWASLKYV